MNITLDEQGTYICKIKNKYSVDEKNITIFVEGKFLPSVYFACSAFIL